LLAYFLLAYLGTWLVFAPMLLSQDGLGLLPYHLPEPLIFLLFFGSTFTGPALAALLVTHQESGKEGVRQLLRRVVRWRVGVQWYLIAIFIFLAIWLVAYGLVYRGAPLTNLIQNPGLLLSVFLPNVLIGLFLPSLGEEPGWRGFALPRLQARYGPLTGTLILGFLHSFWHLVAFFTPLLGPFTVSRFLAFVLSGMAGAVIFTWIFNNTRASILLAMLVHGASNAATQLLVQVIPMDEPLSGWLQVLVPDWLNVIAFGSAAVLLVLLTRGRLSYKGGSQLE
jgi:membrane protease YdiL (CAAX protease family)